jgi:hypothetical protein
LLLQDSLGLGAVRLRQIGRRLYADFAMPCRLDLYRDLLLLARARGYEIVSVARLWNLIQSRGLPPDQNFLVLRHDIDTGIRTARRMWEIDKALGVYGSYYFRLSTKDVPLMREIHRSGGEASYHYEEIATEAKRRGLRTEEEVRATMPETQDLFRRNLEWLRRESGAPMTIVASHGDWANRRLGIANWALLEDREFRRQIGVELEVYDDEFRNHLKSRHSDRSYPLFWEGEAPYRALVTGVPVVYLLVHPRHWRVDRRDNVRDDFGRLLEGLRFR